MSAAFLDTLVAWLATYALHSTALLVLAWAVTRLPRLAPPVVIETVGRAALYGGVLTASLHVAFGAPLWRAPVVAAAPAPNVEAAAVRREIVVTPTPVSAPIAAPVALPTEAFPPPSPPPEPPTPPDLRWLLVLWPLGALLWIGRDTRLRRRLARALAARRDARDPSLLGTLEALRDEAGMRRHIRLTTTASATSPFAFGVRRPEICVPDRALSTLAPDALEALLAHEVAHLMRRDPLRLACDRILAALLFFQPLNALTVARLRDAAERGCDAWAARREHRRLALADCLTTVATWIVGARAPAPVSAMAASPSRLGTRVRILLAGPVARPDAGRRAALGLAALVVLAVLVGTPGLTELRAEVVPAPTPSPALTLDEELALLEAEVAEVAGLLEARDRAPLAETLRRRVETLRALRARLESR